MAINRDYRSFRMACGADEIPFVEDFLKAEGYEFQPEPFSPWCRQLLSEPQPLGASLAASFGYIYIQNRSAMLPPLALNPAPGSPVLDMCASPGGKSSFLAQLAGPEGFVLANEPANARLATLRANLERLCVVNAGTCSFPGEKLPLAPGSWPYILLDPPCSGWGTVEKNPRVLKLWSGAKIDRLAAIQRSLLRKACELLKPGGLLLYSTCTTNRAENEEQTIFAENELGLERIPLQPFPGFKFEKTKGAEGSLLVAGEASNAQGFYLSLLRKPQCRNAQESEASSPAGFARILEKDSGHMPIENRKFPGGRDSGCPRRMRGKTALLPRNDASEEIENRYFQLQNAIMDSEILDVSRLPPGNWAIFNGKARFIPATAAVIPPDFSWRGFPLGSYCAAAGFTPAPRARCLARKPGDNNAVILDDIKTIRALLSGQSMRTDLKSKLASIWWGNLPLGFVSLKNGRILPAFR